jgi:predicted HTH domain antitoxin
LGGWNDGILEGWEDVLRTNKRLQRKEGSQGNNYLPDHIVFLMLTNLSFCSIFCMEVKMTFVEALKFKAPEIKLHRKEDLIEREIAEVVALHLYSQSQITSGTAANIIVISRVDFLQLAGKEKIPMFEYSEEELTNELKEI